MERIRKLNDRTIALQRYTDGDIFYSGLGVSALLLQIVPVANILFSFTNACGAALYAADIEKGSNAGLKTDPKRLS